MMIAKSCAHLRSVDETYWEHQFIAFRYGFICLQAALAAFIHALVPALFETTASDKVMQLAQRRK